MVNVIHQYIRNNKKQLIGVMLALKDEQGVIRVGWSKCNKLDVFDKQRGIDIATGRALKHKQLLDQIVADVPRVVVKPLANFVDRANRYFNPVTKRVYPPKKPVQRGFLAKFIERCRIV